MVEDIADFLGWEDAALLDEHPEGDVITAKAIGVGERPLRCLNHLQGQIVDTAEALQGIKHGHSFNRIENVLSSGDNSQQVDAVSRCRSPADHP